MDGSQLIPFYVVLAAGAAALWSAWCSESHRHAILGGGVVAMGLAFVTPPCCLFLMLIGDRLLPGELVGIVFVLGGVHGVMTAVLAALPGAIAAVLGRNVALALCPVGSNSDPGESISAVYARLGGTMTLTKALMVIIGMTVVGGALGCLGGYLLGTYNPAYYRGVFGGGHRPEFDPVAVGIGLGLSQWAAGGLVVGTILVVVLTWHDLRCRQIAADAARPTAREESMGPAVTGVMRDVPRPG